MTRSCFTRLHRGLLAAALLASAGGALAQATIDHNKALAGNVTPGDAPGYPIVRTRAGHYKLMGNLTVPADTTGIVITADNVTLDLNGFTVAGQAQCTRDAATRAVSCTGASALLRGIVAWGGGGGGVNAVVRNGRIMGFGIGLSLDANSLAQDLIVVHNVNVGITTNTSARVERVHASLNGSGGIILKSGAVLDSVAAQNGGHGVGGLSTDSLAVTLVGNSVATGNAQLGITRATVRGTLQGDNGQVNRTVVRSAGGNADANGIY